MEKQIKPGKQFELDFKNSIPINVWFYRFKDAPNDPRDYQAEADSNKHFKKVFTQRNICDCAMFANGLFFLLELKSLKGKSYSFTNTRDKQELDLSAAATFGINAGLIINFRDVNETFYIDIRHYKKLKDTSCRKSIPIDVMRTECIIITQNQPRTHWKYDISGFIYNYKNEQKNVY